MVAREANKWPDACGWSIGRSTWFDGGLESVTRLHRQIKQGLATLFRRKKKKKKVRRGGTMRRIRGGCGPSADQTAGPRSPSAAPVLRNTASPTSDQTWPSWVGPSGCGDSRASLSRAANVSLQPRAKSWLPAPLQPQRCEIGLAEAIREKKKDEKNRTATRGRKKGKKRRVQQVSILRSRLRQSMSPSGCCPLLSVPAPDPLSHRIAPPISSIRQVDSARCALRGSSLCCAKIKKIKERKRALSSLSFLFFFFFFCLA